MAGKYSKYEDQIELIIEYIKNGEKEKDELAIGLEIEHIIIDKDSKKRQFYYGHRGVKEVLEKILETGKFIGDYSGDNIIGMHNDKLTISIEPGAQFEISISRDASIKELINTYHEALSIIKPILSEMNLSLMLLGIDPENKVDDIPLIPKDRYKIMNEYLYKKGELSRSMMRQTCSLQVSCDFENENDFRRKYQVLTALSPVLYTLFDNSSYHNGEHVPHYNMRQIIWNNTDPDRCGIVSGVFSKDFGYETYAKWLLNIPILFIPVGDIIEEVGEETLSEALSKAESYDEAMNLIRHAISIVFPDIRVKNYLEIRQMDSVPEKYAFAAAALLKGVLYSEEALDELSEYFSEAVESMVVRGKNSGHDNGIQGYYFSDYFARWGLRLIELAKKGLSEEESMLINPLYELWNNLDTPRSIFERIEEREGYLKAIEAFEV